VHWIDLAHRDRWLALVNAVMNLRVLENAENFLTTRGHVSFSERTLFPRVRQLDNHRHNIRTFQHGCVTQNNSP
jgi:hypothetical protein